MKGIYSNKHRLMNCWLVLIVMILSCLILFHSISAVTGLSKVEMTNTIRAGSFHISNTSDYHTLIEPEIYGLAIGHTVNVTITLHDNSSTAVNFSVSSWYKGEAEFQVNPNETHSELYVNHFVSDDAHSLDLEYCLAESEKNASGMYQVEELHPGYHVNVGTSSLYVHNITAWLERQSTLTIPTTTTTLTMPSWNIPVLLLTLCIIISMKQRKIDI